MSKEIIEPKLLKGFRDFLPPDEIRRRTIQDTLEKTFRLHGFVPIDTPVLEYTDVLLGKGGGETDKQVYRFIDHGSRDVAMRFDLTVPFARYMAAHHNELYLPFKRYHMGKVWRGENTQRGRYREFVQCDFDIVGVDSFSADFEILLLIKRSFEAIGIPDISIHVSSRKLFNRFIEREKLSGHVVEILRIVDKLGKIGEEEVREQLLKYTDEAGTKRILSFIDVREDWRDSLQECILLAGGEEEETGRLHRLLSLSSDLGFEDSVIFNPSITRGLDYYTDTVFETFLTGYPKIGSVCSGGRYNDLASLYIDQHIPGVGASIGLDRLIAALEYLEDGREDKKALDVLILCLENTFYSRYHSMAETFRNQGISAEVYPEKKKLSAQFQLAEKKGIPLGLICGEDEINRDVVT